MKNLEFIRRLVKKDGELRILMNQGNCLETFRSTPKLAEQTLTQCMTNLYSLGWWTPAITSLSLTLILRKDN